MATRFVDSGRDLQELVLATLDVQCPRCGAQAFLVPRDDQQRSLHMPRRLSCPACGFTRDHDGAVLAFDRTGVDPCFGHPLWLRVEVRHGTVWAYHRAHAEELRAYVAATLRDRSRQSTWRNRAYLSRLPMWIRSAKNREAMLAALDRLLRSSEQGRRAGGNR